MSAARIVTVAVAALLTAPALHAQGTGTAECRRGGLVALPSAAPKVDERALLDAACGTECVLECPREAGQDEEPPQQLVAHYEGSFQCPGTLESVVSLFPCFDAMGMHGIAGTVVLMRATRPPGRAARAVRWRKADTVEQTVLNDACKVVRVGDRDVVACLSGWGPYQGIMGESLCVVGGPGGFGVECPLRAEDSCNAGIENAFSATVESWSVGERAADGSRAVRVAIKRAGCDGKGVRTLEAVVVLDTSGAHLAPETAALLKTIDIGQE